VILPDVGGTKLAEVRRGIGVKRGHDRHVEWVFDLPPSEFVQADEVLAAYRGEREADAAYEELCKFYVALTRAKHANYIIAAPRGKSSTSNNFIKLLDLTLGADKKPAEREFGGVKAEVVYESNTKATDPRWFDRPKKAEKPVEVVPPTPVTSSGRQRPVRRTPSGSETSVVTAKQLFSRGGRFARSYGTLVHALFEQIEWLDETDDAALTALWAAVPCADESVRQRAEEEDQDSGDLHAATSVFQRTSDGICPISSRFRCS
jgi:ATP-dependent helicase/nuclease subunit A